MPKSPWNVEQKEMKGKLEKVYQMSTKHMKLGIGDSKSTEEEKQKQVKNKPKDLEELKETSLVLILQLLGA